MSEPSRRRVVSGLAAAPLAGGASADPVTDMVRAWIAERGRADALLIRWGRLEHRRPGIGPSREMREIERRLDEMRLALDAAAGRIVALRAGSAASGLAKIEMALRILEPLDCEPFCWELIQGGYEDLRAVLGARSG